MKSLAARRGRPVAELIRQALEEYLSKETRMGGSLLHIPPHASGDLLEDWDRSELLDEMLAP